MPNFAHSVLATKITIIFFCVVKVQFKALAKRTTRLKNKRRPTLFQISKTVLLFRPREKIAKVSTGEQRNLKAQRRTTQPTIPRGLRSPALPYPLIIQAVELHCRARRTDNSDPAAHSRLLREGGASQPSPDPPHPKRKLGSRQTWSIPTPGRESR